VIAIFKSDNYPPVDFGRVVKQQRTDRDEQRRHRRARHGVEERVEKGREAEEHTGRKGRQAGAGAVLDRCAGLGA
jgi:hypothetical protein